MTEQPGPLPPQRQAELDVFTQIRAWTGELLALRLCGPDGGESDLLGYHDQPNATLDLTHAHPSGLAMLLAGRRIRLSDLVREHGALADARRRARAVRAVADRLRRVHGVPAGQLAVGMASWGEDPERRTFAPVLLRVARLHPRGHGEDDFDIDLAPATRLNPVLVEHLRVEYGVPLDAGVLAALAAGPGGFDPLPILRRLAETCEDIPGFAVEPRLVVGVFPEVVPALVADLEANGATLVRHPVIRQLTSPVHDASEPGPAVVPAEPLGVLDVDDDELAVVSAAVSGARLAVSAPPGSGATQALAVAVGALAARGRRTLLLSAYADDLVAVRDRLATVGLGDLVLDLGADPHDGAQVAARLLAAVEQVEHADDEPYDDDHAPVGPSAIEGPGGPDAPGSGRHQALDSEGGGPEQPDPAYTVAVTGRLLESHVTTMHAPHEPWGVSAYQAQVALAALTALRPAPRSRVRLPAATLDALPPHRVAELRGALRGAAVAGAFRFNPANDPWYGARVTSPEQADAALAQARALADGELPQARSVLDGAFEEVGLPAARTVADYTAGLALLEQVRSTVEIFRAEAWDTSVGEAVAATAPREWRSEHGVALGAMARRRIQARTRKLLRPGAPPADLHGALVRLHQQRTAWEQFVGGGARPSIPAAYDDAVAAHRHLVDRLEALAPVLVHTPAGADLTQQPLDQLHLRLAAMAERPQSLSSRPQVVELLDTAYDAGLGELVEDLAARGVVADLVGPELDLVWWSSVLGQIGASDPQYAGHDGEALRAAAAAYGDADRQLHAQQAVALQGAMADRVRRAVEAHPDQVAELRALGGISAGEHGGALMARPRVAVPVARVLAQCADLVAAIAPCWSLSPLVAASVLPPDVTFDVVLVAQAQAVALSSAVTAIGRGACLVAVGDVSLGGPVRPGESLMDLALARLPHVRLHSAYRPVSHQLSALASVVSSRVDATPDAQEDADALAEVVLSQLVATPGTDVRLVRVDGAGVLAPGAAAVESTEVEVQRVVRLVVEHARTRPEESLAVLALNRLHAEHIREAVRLERDLPPAVAAFFDTDRAEPFVVLDARDAGSLVRDVVVLSIGYSRTPHGRVLLQFGAVSEPGGVELLLSAVTRARSQVVVVSAIEPADLDVSRLKSSGPRALRDLLSFAGGKVEPVSDRLGTVATQGIPVVEVEEAPVTTGVLDALLEDFALRLEADGLVVERAVALESPTAGDGRGAGSIDLLVSEGSGPGPRVAVDSDGPAYAAHASVRDRDRMQPERVERLGYPHLRVWSTDLFRDPAREVARVRSALRPPGWTPPDDLDDLDGLDSVDSVDDADESSGTALNPGGAADPVRVVDVRDGSAALERSADDTDLGWGEMPPGADSHDDWLREQRPPHWG